MATSMKDFAIQQLRRFLSEPQWRNGGKLPSELQLAKEIGVSRPIVRQALATLRDEGYDRLHLAWAGAEATGEPHYYRIQGPTFLIEYDNTQGDGNHAHSVWRDFKGDFGRDQLAAHYQQFRHAPLNADD